MVGVVFVFAMSSLNLSFTVIPVLLVVWVLDYRSLPSYLWRYEGKEGAHPHSSKSKGGASGGGTSEGLSTLLAPSYSISAVMPAFEYSDATSGGSGAVRNVRACYGLSVAFLACYVYAAW